MGGVPLGVGGTVPIAPVAGPNMGAGRKNFCCFLVVVVLICFGFVVVVVFNVSKINLFVFVVF